MSRFVNKTVTVEIALADGATVHIRQRLTAAEEAELDRRLVRMRFNTTTRQVDVEEGDWHRQNIEVVRAYLTDWDFKDEDGQAVAFEPHKVDDLDGDTIRELSKVIDDYQRARREEREKKAPR